MVSHQLGGKPAAGISLLVIFTLFGGRDVECMHTQFGPQLGTLTVARPATPRGVGTQWEDGLVRVICTGMTRTGRIPAQCVNVNECGLILTNGTSRTRMIKTGRHRYNARNRCCEPETCKRPV